jgi:predicted kinase
MLVYFTSEMQQIQHRMRLSPQQVQQELLVPTSRRPVIKTVELLSHLCFSELDKSDHHRCFTILKAPIRLVFTPV